MRNSNSHKLRLNAPNPSANLSSAYPLLPLVVERILGWNIGSEDWTLMWTDHSVSIDQARTLNKNQRINHFPGMFELSRKNRLARNLNSLKKQFPDEYDFYPETWELPLEFNLLQEYYNDHPSFTYIVKPEAGCQGRGIYLTNSVSELEKCRGHIVQRYIDKPYLIDNLKFDFRLYVLVTCVNPLRIYVFDEGLARFATEQFTPPDAWNLKRTFTHLTNYSINKENSNFRASEEDFSKGHKRSLKKVLQEINDPSLWGRINDIIIKTLIAGQPELSSHYKSAQPHNINCCFELLGFDIILDHQLKPYLLEINHTPSFNIDTALDKKVKVDVLTNTIKMVCRDLFGQLSEDEEVTKKYKHEYLSYILEYQLKEKDSHEMKNIGRFSKVYPPLVEERAYGQFLRVSNDLFHKKYGTNIIRRKKKVYEEAEEFQFAPKLNQHSELEKVYKKAQLRPVYNIRVQLPRRLVETPDDDTGSKRRSHLVRERTALIYASKVKTAMSNFRSSSGCIGR